MKKNGAEPFKKKIETNRNRVPQFQPQNTILDAVNLPLVSSAVVFQSDSKIKGR